MNEKDGRKENCGSGEREEKGKGEGAWKENKTETMKKSGSVIMSDKPLSEFRPRFEKSGKKKLVDPGWSWMPVLGNALSRILI